MCSAEILRWQGDCRRRQWTQVIEGVLHDRALIHEMPGISLASNSALPRIAQRWLRASGFDDTQEEIDVELFTEDIDILTVDACLESQID